MEKTESKDQFVKSARNSENFTPLSKPEVDRDLYTFDVRYGVCLLLNKRNDVKLRTQKSNHEKSNEKITKTYKRVITTFMALNTERNG